MERSRFLWVCGPILCIASSCGDDSTNGNGDPKSPPPKIALDQMRAAQTQQLAGLVRKLDTIFQQVEITASPTPEDLGELRGERDAIHEQFEALRGPDGPDGVDWMDESGRLRTEIGALTMRLEALLNG